MTERACTPKVHTFVTDIKFELYIPVFITKQTQVMACGTQKVWEKDQAIIEIIYWNKHMCSEVCVCVARYPKCSEENTSKPAEAMELER